MSEYGICDFYYVKLKVFERLGIFDVQSLLCNDEIEQVLCEYQWIFQVDIQLQCVCCCCEVVVEVMCFFVVYQLCLVGVVFEGIVDVYLVVCLYLFVEDLDDVLCFFDEYGVLFEIQICWL